MIINFSELPKVREERNNEIIVFRGGCFDLLHEGHIEGLHFSKGLGDALAVGVISDLRVIQKKGPSRPIQPQISRLAVIDALRDVDYSFIMPGVISQGSPTPTMQVMTSLRPDIFVEHVSQAENWQDDIDLLKLLGVELIFDTSPKKNSTSAIIEKIQDASILKNVE